MFRSAIDRLQAARRDQRGFTLIELLIVIVILGILAAVVVFSVRGITDNGEQAACKTEFRIVDTAIEAFYADRGTDPADLDELVSEGFLKSAPDEYVTGIGGDPLAATGANCDAL